jgi:pimeloyl-ACP methyl ester carboxylesterase
MAGAEPILLIPGLLCSARLYAEQVPALWRHGPVTIADHTRDDSMGAIARRILDAAPPRFALAGLSMGGYIAFEILRQARERVTRLALLDTSARADTPAQTERRRAQMELARAGRLDEVVDQQMPLLFHPDHLRDEALCDVARVMAEETGPEAFVREQTAIIRRPDSRPQLAAVRCPTLVLVGDHDALTPPELSSEMAAGIEGSRLVTVPHSGHATSLEHPDQVTDALVAWLQA